MSLPARTPTLKPRFRISKQPRRSRSSRTVTSKEPSEIRRAISDTLTQADGLANEQRAASSKLALDKYTELFKYALESSDRETEVRALRSSGHTLEFLDQSEKALDAYRHALEIARRVKNRDQEAGLLADIATLQAATGNNSAALDAATQALRISEHQQNENEAQAFYARAEATYGRGDLPLAQDYYLRALELWRQLQDKSKQAESLIGLGYDYSNSSEPRKAFTAYNEAIALSREANDPHIEALALRGLGNLQTKQGEPEQALEVLFQALKQLENYENRLVRARVIAAIGYAYENLGETSQAIQYDDQATAIFREIGNRWGEAELEWDLGELHFLRGDNDDALQDYQQALTLFAELKIPRLQAQTLRDMGVLYDKRGEKKTAMICFQNSLSLTRSDQDQRYKAYTLNYLGRLNQELRDSAAARQLYSRALRLSRAAADSSGESFTLFNLARLELASGNQGEARNLIEQSLKLTDDLRSRVLSGSLRAAYAASVHQYYELYVDILMQSAIDNNADNLTRLAFEASEKAHARTFVESLRESHANITQDLDSELAERQQKLEAALNSKAELRARLAGEKDEKEAKQVSADIETLTSEYQQLEAEIKAGSPRYATLTQTAPMTTSEIQQSLLDPDTVLLEYMLGDERSYLWVVTKSQLVGWKLPDRTTIEAEARRFHDLLIASQPISGESFDQRQKRISEVSQQVSQEAASFTDLILGPAIKMIANKRLMIVPDGALQYIPFQALTVPQQNPSSNSQTWSTLTRARVPMILDHEIVYEPSASALALVMSDRAKRPAASKSVAIFANPVFEADDPRVKLNNLNEGQMLAVNQMTEVHNAFRDVGGNDLKRVPPLPGSRAEAKAIIALAPWRTTFDAEDFSASQATIRGLDFSQFRIVHFATHGFVDYEHPELSGLVLTLVDEQGRPQEGFLRMHDIYHLKLPVDLVVLSACNTGIGKEVRGEGMIGLTRAFMYAGAGGVAASLWKVDDDATAELMELFYEGLLKKGLTPSAALRQAQITMLERKPWKSPYYWAAFTLQGEYQHPLIPSPRISTKGIFLGTTIVAALLFSGFLAIKFGRRRFFYRQCPHDNGRH